MLRALTAVFFLMLIAFNPISARADRHDVHTWGAQSFAPTQHVRTARYFKNNKVKGKHQQRRYRERSHYASADVQIMAHPAGCPSRAFCGCGVSVHVFGKPVRELWLAANWFAFPRGAAGPGMVAVRRHHVMAILTAHGDGSATVYDPNSGSGLTRIHRRSLAGYVVVDPRAGRRYAFR